MIKTKSDDIVASLQRQIDAHGFGGFAQATATQIKLLPEGSADRLILEFLLKNAGGITNAKCWSKISKHLKANGASISKQKFQNNLLQKSRKSPFFIGSCHRGYFIIESARDVASALEFYNTRIRQEIKHRHTLEFLAKRCGLTPLSPASVEFDEAFPEAC